MTLIYAPAPENLWRMTEAVSGWSWTWGCSSSDQWQLVPVESPILMQALSTPTAAECGPPFSAIGYIWDNLSTNNVDYSVSDSTD